MDEDQKYQESASEVTSSEDDILAYMFTNFLIWLKAERTDIGLYDKTDRELRRIAKNYIKWSKAEVNRATAVILDQGGKKK